MKKVMSLMLVFSVVFMGFASTLAQSSELASPQDSVVSFDAFSAELSEDELAEIDGEVGIIEGIIVGTVTGIAANAVLDNFVFPAIDQYKEYREANKDKPTSPPQCAGQGKRNC